MILEACRLPSIFAPNKTISRQAFLVFAVVLFLISTSDIFGQYQIKSWTTDSGLPQNTVHSILQTPDGYLWFATLDGLIRFDGVKFTIFNKNNSTGIESNRFTQLLIDSQGDLWIGTEESGVTRYRNGEFQTFPVAETLPNEAIRNLILSDQGEILAITNLEIARWNGEKFTPYEPADGKSADDLKLWSKNGAPRNVNPTILTRFVGKTVSLSFSPETPEKIIVNKFLKDRRGRLWIGTADSGLLMLDNEQLTKFTVKEGVPSDNILPSLEDRSGNIWAITDKGAAVISNGRVIPLTTAEGLSDNAAASIYEDREGEIWIGTFRRGLNRVTAQSVAFYTRKDGLLTDGANPIFEDTKGDVWIGGGDLTHRQNGVFKAAEGYRSFSKETTAIHEDRAGRLWFGNRGGASVYENGVFTYFSDKFPARGSVVDIHEDRTGNLWFATNVGLYRWQNEAMTLFTVENGLASNDVKVVHESGDGTLWIGTYGGLSHYANDSFSTLTTNDGLAGNKIRALYEEADGTIWIGSYDSGLTRLKSNKFTRYTSREGLFNDGVFQILEDTRGNFWMSSNRGIYRVAKQQLNDFADGKISHIDSIAYGKDDGLLETECNGGQQPAGMKAQDGKLWFPTQNGVAVIDPDTVTNNNVPPPVVIESVKIDNNSMANNQKGIEIAPNQNNLEIAYTGLSFIKPQYVKFRYKLSGLDENWVEANDRRTAYFSYIPPGEYTFQVIAANSDGVWNTEGASVKVRVIPPFYRTWWFGILVFISVGGAAFVFYQRRVTHLEKEKSAQQAFSSQLIKSQEQDRKRIAAELHDGLGQSLVIIKNRALMSLDKRGESERAFEQLDEIASAATEAINEVREITYNLRPYQLDRLGLSKAIVSMIRRTGDALEFKTEIDNIDSVFASENEINVYRVVQESINNILKHSKATRAEIQIKRKSSQIEILIKDNGKGFEKNNSADGFGLIGISERVRMLGGEFSIQSAPGQGTSINIKLPINDSAQKE
jgi:signal transduction histidine kinase/ligand-binding sensor domain-containing protein